MNAHDLPTPLREIIESVRKAPQPVTQLDLARTYGGGSVEQLKARGHLTEAIVAGKPFLVVAPLTERELVRYRPWKSHEDRSLREGWTAGRPIGDIAHSLNRTGGAVVTRARTLGCVRPHHQRDGFRCHVPAWRIRRLRLALVDAERRGLDVKDSGRGLAHRALLRRLIQARTFLTSGPESIWQCWSPTELTALRKLREEGRSLERTAQILGRPTEDVAHRMMLEGRSVGGDWSEEEDATIIQGIKEGISYRQIASRIPGRTMRTVKRRIKQMSLSSMGRRPWSGAELRALLKGAAEGLRGKKLAACVPSRGEHSVRRKFYQITRQSRINARWTEFDFHLMIRAMRRREPASEIALWLDRDISGVQERIDDLKSRRKGAPPALTPKQARQAQRMQEESGKPWHEIADHFGVTRTTLGRAIKRLDEVPWKKPNGLRRRFAWKEER